VDALHVAINARAGNRVLCHAVAAAVDLDTNHHEFGTASPKIHTSPPVVLAIGLPAPNMM
jgi:hypothetical protein